MQTCMDCEAPLITPGAKQRGKCGACLVANETPPDASPDASPDAPPDTETFTAKVGTVEWARIKHIRGEQVIHESDLGLRRESNPLYGGAQAEGWIVKPAEPPPPPTLDEALDVLLNAYNTGNFTKAVDILSRAGRLPKKDGEK